jgi:hypothetical protein
MRAARICASLVFATAFAPATANAVIIDTFEVGPYGPISDTTPGDGPGPSATQTGLPVSHVIGGERTAWVELNVGTEASAELALTPVDDGATFTIQPSYASAKFSQRYAGPGGLGLGGIDLTAAGSHDRILFSIADNPGGGNFIILLTDTDGDRADIQPNVNQSGVYTALYEDFHALSGQLNFDAIDQIDISLGYRSTDDPYIGTVSDIRTAPEPATLTLLLLGTLTAGRTRRR